MAKADEDDEALQLVSVASYQLSMKMLLEAIKAEPESLGLSGMSVFTPLSLISLIADGPTHQEILKAVGFKNDLSLISSMTIENSHLHTAEGINIKTGSIVFLPDTVYLDEEFVIKNNIFTALQVFDHKKPARAVADINKWVADQTDNKIDYLVSRTDVDKNSKAIIANVLYFKGEWENGFEVDKTKSGTFHVTDTEQTEVMYMFQGNRFVYAKSDELNAQILVMPYVNMVASFVIILPNEMNGLEDLINKIKDPSILRKANLTEHTVGVTIPIFEIETTLDLRDILQKVGIKTLFSPAANLQKLLKHSNPTNTSVSEPVENSTNTNVSEFVENSTNTNVSESIENSTNTNVSESVENSTNTNAADAEPEENSTDTDLSKAEGDATRRSGDNQYRWKRLRKNPKKKKTSEKVANKDPHKTAKDSKDTNFFVTKAIQKTVIAIDEAGKKSTANVAQLPGDSEEITYRLNFKADHPFFFLIMEDDLILYTGVYKS